MKRIVYVFLALFLFIPFYAERPERAQAGPLASAVMDPLIEKALASSDTAQVIVTFKGDGAPKSNQLSLLETLGIETGITMKSCQSPGSLRQNRRSTNWQKTMRSNLFISTKSLRIPMRKQRTLPVSTGQGQTRISV
ncbi:hypothetical protein [Bacillus sp. CECT 9360]|uniref:hypothetical protein n=1 Tax=Bacillus sp. CECT 9360 TaxID=2845821 RepID=UPI001E63FB5D|nr:hypothetical protein [Bacillus sp. CECT 9360]